MVRKKRRSRAKKDDESPLIDLRQDDVETKQQEVEKAAPKSKEEPKPKPKAQPVKISKAQSAGKRFGSFLKEVRAEMKKVSWPDRERTMQSTGVVLFTLTVLSLAMTVFTMIFTRIAEYLFS